MILLIWDNKFKRSLFRLLDLHREKCRKDIMVVIVQNYSIIVYLLEKASLQINEVFSFNLHYSCKTINKSLYFLVIVQFVGYNCSHRQYPCTLLKFDFSFGQKSIANEEAEWQIDEEWLRWVIYQRNAVKIHFHLWDLYWPYSLNRVFRNELVAEFLTWRWKILLHYKNRYFLRISPYSTTLIFCLLLILFSSHFSIKTNSRTHIHFLKW